MDGLESNLPLVSTLLEAFRNFLMEFTHINIPKVIYLWIGNALIYQDQLIKWGRNPLGVLTLIETSPHGSVSISYLEHDKEFRNFLKGF